MKRILIIGSKSTIGSSFYKFLIKDKSFSISVIDRVKKNKDIFIFNNNKILKNISEINEVLSENEFIFSFLGSNKKKLFNKNQKEVMNSTLKFANLAAKSSNLKKFIFLSSFAVYDEKTYEKINYNTPTNPNKSYGKYKVLTEKKLLDIYKNNLLKLHILRIPIVLDSDKNSVKILEKLLSNLFFRPLITNKNRRSYVTKKYLNYFFLFIISKNLDKTILLFSNKSTFSSDQLITELFEKNSKLKISASMPKIDIYFILKLFSLFNFSFANKLLFSSELDQEVLKEYVFLKEHNTSNLPL